MSTSREFTLKGGHVLIMMLLFFGAVIAVNTGFIVMAMRSFPGEDVAHSYTQGVEYNQTLAERRAQAALGWTAAAGLQQGADGAVVEVTLRDRAGAPIEGATVTGQIRREATSAFDQNLSFAPLGGGRYAAPAGALQHGRWQLRAHAQDAGGEALDFDAELTWQP
ncbi:MAG: FixH family protein [Hyphomonadaceae bacterium]|nr:FixH family protein [Hyphomonadaceae bacterium]